MSRKNLQPAGAAIVLARSTAVCALLLSSQGAAAETLPQALSQAYLDNPVIAAERARQRATDEQEPQALSGWRPTVEARASSGHTWITERPRGTTQSDPNLFAIKLSQPLFRGFRTVNSTKQARANIAAGRHELVAVEQQILLSAASAYMDVIRDREVLRLRRGQVSLLKAELRGANGRFNLGEVTRTDVAQARARLNSAIANMKNSIADLGVSAGNYARVMGRAPGILTRPPVSRRAPRSLSKALSRAGRFNPELLAVLQKEISADLSVEIKKGQLLPQLDLQAEYEIQQDPSTVLTSSEAVSVRGVLRIPLYQSGKVYSQIRQAKQLASRKRLLSIEARRKVRNQIVRLWHRYREAAAKIAANKAQIGAAMVALQGVRREASFGNRTTLDILDAERELLSARETLETVRRDHVVRGYELVAAVGGMTASNLGLSVAAYDPLANYHDVRNQWFGTSIAGD